MMNNFYHIRPVERITKSHKLSEQMPGKSFSEEAKEERKVNFSDTLREACKHNEDSLARGLENKVHYYGSNAQAVYYTMTMSRSFKA